MTTGHLVVCVYAFVCYIVVYISAMWSLCWAHSKTKLMQVTLASFPRSKTTGRWYWEEGYNHYSLIPTMEDYMAMHAQWYRVFQVGCSVQTWNAKLQKYHMT